MVPRQPWFERRFTFDLPVAAAPGLLERLRERMRLLDLAFFIAEHDDHHLATISDLLRRPD